MNILLFEDDEGIALLTKEALEKENFQVELAYSGGEGIPKAKAMHYDLVLLDLQTPDQSRGMEF